MPKPTLPEDSETTVAGIQGPFDATGILSKRVRRHREFGLYDKNGFPVPNCDIVGRLTHSTPLARSPGHPEEDVIDGPVLFAGLAPKQFGHVILNSLGRLWALEHLPNDTALLYLPQIRPIPERYPYVLPLVELLGIKSPILLHNRPTRYRQLFTAEDWFGERHGGKMTAEMRSWLGRKLPSRKAVTKGRSVYFTRARLGYSVGRYCNEDVLEELLSAAGFEVVAPEHLSLSEQIAIMQEAETLVFAESSALHLYGLVQRQGQRVCVIQRRPKLPQLIKTQLDDGPADIHFVEVISSVYWPPDPRDSVSIAELDFNRLRDALVSLGCISSAAPWRVPDKTEVSVSLRAGLPSGATLIPDSERAAWLRAHRRRRPPAKAFKY